MSPSRQAGQFVTGGGAPLYQVNTADHPDQQVAYSTHHYVAVDVGPVSVTLRASGIDGGLLDWFVLPVKTATARRLLSAWCQQLGQGVHVAGDGLSLVVPLRNPLDFDLAVCPSGHDTLQTLPPGQERGTSRVAAALALPPWCGRVTVPVTLRVRGDESRSTSTVETTPSVPIATRPG